MNAGGPPGGPPFPPNGGFPPPGQQQGPPGQAAGPGGIHPDRLRMMGGESGGR